MKLAMLAAAGALIAPATLAAPPPQDAKTPAASATPTTPSDDRDAARGAVRQACAADLKSLCPDMQGKEARKCMRANQAKLSSGCQEAVAKAPRGKRGG